MHIRRKYGRWLLRSWDWTKREVGSGLGLGCSQRPGGFVYVITCVRLESAAGYSAVVWDFVLTFLFVGMHACTHRNKCTRTVHMAYIYI